jgi:outer membrane biosynthesis protein TonB
LSRVERNPDRNAWLTAWAVTLALHAAAVLLLLRLPPPMPEKTIHRIEPIRLVFAKPGPEAAKTQEPHIFSELPPDRKDAAPKHPEFLSNVTSRARDRAPGGNDAMPRMQGETDAPMVKLQSDGGASPPAPPAPAPQHAAPSSPLSAETPQPKSPAKEQTGVTGATTSPTESPANRAVTGASPHDLAGSGSSDIDQPEMDNPEGNAGLTGDVSLSTIAWDYAPWLQRFGRQLMHRWIPPPAYTMGILKEGGWAVIDVEISRSGEMLRLQVLEEKGHPSLSRSAQSALRSMAPIEALPADFPEPTLKLRIRMIYPRIRPR